jgi:hypothetical protein
MKAPLAHRSVLDKVVTWAQVVQTGAKEIQKGTIQKGTISSDHVTTFRPRFGWLGRTDQS